MSDPKSSTISGISQVKASNRIAKPFDELGEIAGEVKMENLKAHVTSLANIGERCAYSKYTKYTKKVAAAKDYIIGQLKKYGLSQGSSIGNQKGFFEQDFYLAEYSDYRIDLFTYSISSAETPGAGQWKNSNIIVRIPGQTASPKKVVLGAHYDSIYGPGANDNASGVAALLEAARILAHHKLKHTVEIVFFSAEEEGAQGSQYYMEQICPSERKDIIGVLIADMIGNNESSLERPSGRNPKSAEDLYLGTSAKNTSRKLLYRIKTAINKHSKMPLEIKITRDLDKTGDDYAFYEKGVPTVEIQEDSPDALNLENFYYHTPDDLPKYIDFTGFFLKAVKAILVSAAALAVPAR